MALYDPGDLLDKVLQTSRALPVYDSYPPYSYKQVGTLPAGTLTGTIYSWISADPTKGRDTIWWMFNGSSGNYYYMPHHPGDFDVDVLGEQGVQSTEQKNTPEPEWYQKILSQVLPIIVIAVIGAAAVKGYFSSRKI